MTPNKKILKYSLIGLGISGVLTTSIVTPIVCSKSQTNNINPQLLSSNYNKWFDESQVSKKSLTDLINNQINNLVIHKSNNSFLSTDVNLDAVTKAKIQTEANNITDDLYNNKTSVKAINEQINSKYQSLSAAQKAEVTQISNSYKTQITLKSDVAQPSLFSDLNDVPSDDPVSNSHYVCEQLTNFADNTYTYFVTMTTLATATSIIALAEWCTLQWVEATITTASVAADWVAVAYTKDSYDKANNARYRIENQINDYLEYINGNSDTYVDLAYSVVSICHDVLSLRFKLKEVTDAAKIANLVDAWCDPETSAFRAILPIIGDALSILTNFANFVHDWQVSKNI